MASSEIMYWSSYFEGNPTDSQRLDYIISLLAMQIADFRNANKTKGKPVSPNEFLPDYLKSPEEKKNRSKSLEQQKAEALQWAAKYK